MTQIPDLQPKDTGCGRRIAWLGAGFVLPFYSPEFYLGTLRKPLREAILFFAVLMTLVAGLSTIRGVNHVESFFQLVLDAFQDGSVTSLTITGGEASIDGDDPLIIKDGDRFFIAVDTQGELDRDSFRGYQGGILITKTLQYSFTAGQDRPFELSNYNLGTGRDPLVFDETIVNQLFATLSVLYPVVGGVAVWVWDVCLWLLFLVISAYFLWGPINQALPEFSFKSMLTIGIYAHVPAFTVQHILSLFGVQVFFIYTTLLLVFWIGALWLVMREVAGKLLKVRGKTPTEGLLALLTGEPPRLWPAWLGLPAVVFMAANTIYEWEFAPLWVLGGTAVTIGILLAIDSTHHQETEKKESTD
jgi:hypothetical protein